MERLSSLRPGRLIIPVVQIEDAGQAVPLAEALARGGLDVIEITLRTPAAPAAVQRIRRALPEVVVGIGTATRPAHFALAAEIGAQFVVSPGLTPALAAAGAAQDLPYLPGVTSPSEIMLAAEHGLAELKFFPAIPSGGTAALAAFAPVFPEVRFCPTGGIGPQNAAEFLQQPNVFAIGGSWMVARDLLRDGRWDVVTRRAQEASALLSGGIAV